MKKLRGSIIILAVAFFASAAQVRAITVDGTLDGVGYGSARAVQTVDTQFGDNFSEWDAGYGTVVSGRLYLMLTGNLEANGNRLDIFIDSKAGGQTNYASAGNDNTANMNGLVFDTGFTADYHLSLRRSGTSFDLDIVNLALATISTYTNVFGGSGAGSSNTGIGAANLSPIGIAYDNSNVGGVVGGSGAANQANALAVTTGMELSIALTDLGAIGNIKVMVGQNNQNHNYWANQFLAGLPAPQGNLGGDEAGNFNGTGAINMTHFAGDQFFIVPEPSTIALVGVGLLGVLTVRRRKA